MTFRPPSGTTSTEKIEDSKLAGFTFSDRTKQFVQGGSVRLLPQLTGDFQQLGAKWPGLNWDHLEHFPSPLGNDILQRWGYEGPVGKTLDFSTYSGYLRFNLTGQTEFLYQSTGAGTGKRDWPDNVGNSIGWVMQTRFEATDTPTGDLRDGASFLFDDGAVRDEIKFTEDRVFLGSNPDIGIAGKFTSPKDFRLMVRGSDLWMWVEGQEGLMHTGALTGASVLPEIRLGAPTGGVTADVRFDYLYQKYTWTADIPVDLAVSFSFTTDEQSTRLPVHAPARSVLGWQKAIVDTSHGETELEISGPYSFIEDWNGKTDNTDLLVTEPENWAVGGQHLLGGGGGMNVDFSGGDGLVHSSSQYVRFIGHGGQLKEDHYVQLTLGPTRVSDGLFIADATARYNPNIILKDDGQTDSYYYRVEWYESTTFTDAGLLIYTIDRSPATAIGRASVVWTDPADIAAFRPKDGKRMRAEIRGRVITVFLDHLDGNGFVETLQWEDTNTAEFPPSDGDPGFWLGPLLSGPNQSCLNDIEIGNFEGETNINVGTTRMRVEYSQDRGETFQLAKVSTISQVPKHEIDLSDVPVAGNGQDALRFTVHQSSLGGLAEAIRVDQVTVKATYDPSGVELYPEWGPRIGGTSVSLKLLDDAYLNCGVQPPLAELTAYGSKGADTSLTGDYNNVKDFPGVGQAYGDPTLVGAPTIALDAISVEDAGTYQSLPAQAVWAEDGDGLEYAIAASTGDRLLEGYLQVQEGSVRVQLDGGEHVFYKGTYVDLRSLGLLWESTGALTLRLLGGQAGSVWKHRLESHAAWTYGGVQGSTQAGHRALRGWAYLDGINTGEQALISSLNTSTGDSGMEIGITADGRPYLRAKDSLGVEDSVTGEFPMVVGKITHVEGGVVGYPDGVSLQLFLNGETCGQKRTTLQSEAYGAGQALGLAEGSGPGDARGSAVRLAEVGAGTGAPDADRIVTQIGLANPVFELDRNWPVRSSTRLLLDFDRKEGAVRDRSGYGNYPVIPEDYRRRTVRGADGYWGRSTFFVAEEGGMQVPYSPGLLPDTGVTLSLFAKAYTDPSVATELWSQENTGGEGWSLEIDTNGYLRFTLNTDTGSFQHTHTGALIGVNAWRAAMLKYDPAAGTVRSRVGPSTWQESSGAPSVSALLTGTDHWIGRGAWGLIDELAWHRELLADSLWDTLTGDSQKYTPNEPITVRGVQASSVRHWGIDQKYFKTPTGALGDTDVNVSTYGKLWPATRPFFYTDIYDIDVDVTRIRGQVCDTKSPFRIGNRVPDGSVNLSMINSPGVGVAANVSFHDMSAEEIANIAFFNQGDFVVQSPDVTGENSGDFAYPPSIDTEEIRISNRSVMRKNFKFPKPLFYMHLLGRGRRYVYHPEATDVGDIDLIRQSIRVETHDGRVVPLEDFAWDIEIQTIDYYQNQLPANHFAVVFYCERVPFGTTYFVVYDAAAPNKGYLRDPGFREVVNPVPIFTRAESGADLGDFEYSMDLDTGGSYSLRIQRS